MEIYCPRNFISVVFSDSETFFRKAETTMNYIYITGEKKQKLISHIKNYLPSPILCHVSQLMYSQIKVTFPLTQNNAHSHESCSTEHVEKVCTE